MTLTMLMSALLPCICKMSLFDVDVVSCHQVREAEERAGLGADAVANLQDLEAEETPETMMVSVLTGDLSDTGRADRCRFMLSMCLMWQKTDVCRGNGNRRWKQPFSGRSPGGTSV